MRLRRLALIAALAGGLAPLLACGGDDAEQEPDLFQAPNRGRDTAVVDTGATADSAAASARGGVAGQAGSPGPARAAREGSGASEGAADGGARAAGGAAVGNGRLYTVQVAAFLEQDSAEEWVRRLASQGWPVWSSVVELRGQTFHRVRIGALPTVDEARDLGRAVSARYEWPVWLTRVTGADRVPAGAVEATRQALDRG